MLLLKVILDWIAGMLKIKLHSLPFCILYILCFSIHRLYALQSVMLIRLGINNDVCLHYKEFPSVHCASALSLEQPSLSQRLLCNNKKKPLRVLSSIYYSSTPALRSLPDLGIGTHWAIIPMVQCSPGHRHKRDCQLCPWLGEDSSGTPGRIWAKAGSSRQVRVWWVLL